MYNGPGRINHTLQRIRRILLYTQESAESKYIFYAYKNFYRKPDSRSYINLAKSAEISHVAYSKSSQMSNINCELFANGLQPKLMCRNYIAKVYHK